MINISVEMIELFDDTLGAKFFLPTFIRKNPINPLELVDDELLRYLHRAGQDRGYELDVEQLISLVTVLKLREVDELQKIEFVHSNLLTHFNKILYKKNLVIDTNFIGEPRYIPEEHAVLFEVSDID